ncbi:hypothetical protein D3C81_1569830 [compost metagenome]
MPTWRIDRGDMAGVTPLRAVSGAGPSPHRQATGMPWILPVGLVLPVLASAWASSHSTSNRLPVSRQWRAAALIEPMARQWSPPISSGIRPLAKQP